MAMAPPVFLDPKKHTMLSILFRSLPVDKSQLEALRLETVRNHFDGQGYSQATVHSLIKTVEERIGPRSPYRHAQYLFFQ
jgi:hypothetical protein